jgi:hypothetical protein
MPLGDQCKAARLSTGRKHVYVLPHSLHTTEKMELKAMSWSFHELRKIVHLWIILIIQ